MKDFIIAMNSIICNLFQNEESIKMISVTAANAGKSSSGVIFFISFIGEIKESEILKTLEEKKKYIKLIFGQKFKQKIKKIPEINFTIDNSIKKGFHIEALTQAANIK